MENARADLFEGARWYLTPTERSSGIHYDRLQRAVADLGARPQAIDPETHDRLMATVSHLPHVLANVLVQQAAAALVGGVRAPAGGRARAFATPPASPGANPAIWGDIFATNREAVAASIDAVVERLQRGRATLIRSGDADAVGRLARRRRRGPPRLLEADLGGRRADRAADRASRTGRAPSPRSRSRSATRGVNIEDMAPLSGARHAHRRRSPSGSRATTRPSAPPRSSAASATSSRSSPAAAER